MSRKSTKKKVDQSKIDNDSWMFAMLLSVVCILSVTLMDYQFHFLGAPLSFAVFVVPFVFFVSNYITKKYGFLDSMKASLIASLIIIAFLILILDLTGRRLDFFSLALPPFIYFTSLFMNASIYYYNLVNIEEHKVLIYFNYIFSFAVYYLFYLLFFYRYVIVDSFWKEYFLSIIVSGIITIGLIYVDSKIKRGLQK